MTKAYDNSLLARNISISGVNTNVSGLLSATSGNFINSLQLNGTGVSISGHTHTVSNITDFNSSVSGLLPVIDIVAGTNITVSPVSGIYTINSSGSTSSLISYPATTSFPASGVSTSYYLASDSSRFYQWTGSQYVEIGSPPTTVSSNDPTVGLTLLHPFLLGGM